MSLERSSTNFRVYEFEAKLTDESLAGFAENALPPIETLKEEPLEGWVSPRHLLDSEIVEDTCRAGKFIHLVLTKAQRKVPKVLLDTYTKMQEIEMMKEEGMESLNRETRRELREDVKKKMLPRMPPSLSGIEVAIDCDANRLYCDSLSTSADERVTEIFAKSARSALIPLTPDTAALRHSNVQTDQLDPVCFTAEPNGDFTIRSAGLDFLMWLFYRYEIGESKYDLFVGSEPINVGLEGPVSLVLQGQGAHTASLAEGEPLHSVECKAALLGGKKIASITIAFEHGEDIYKARVDGQTFQFHKVTVPKMDENRDAQAIFLDHMVHLQSFTEIFYKLYEVFLKVRTDEAAWNKVLADIQAWLPTLPAEK